jgi:hypothetical protein
MFDTPVDAWYAWLGVSAAALVVFGVVTSLPTAPPPDAAGAAETIDAVAAAEYDTTAVRALDARAVDVDSQRIGLRNDAGTTHATLGYRVVPVGDDARLARVLRGAPPRTVFAAATAFERAASATHAGDSAWRPAGDYLVARHCSWGDVDVTLVGTLDARPGGR